MIQFKGRRVKLSTQRLRPLYTMDWILKTFLPQANGALKITLAEDLTHNILSRDERINDMICFKQDL